LNNKEKAHRSVKLLMIMIAAIVILAIVIFGILNPIIMSVMTIDGTRPWSETKNLLTDLVGSPGVLKHTPEMTFEPNCVIAANDLVRGLPITSDRICMSIGQFAEDPVNGFECIGCEDASDNQRLVYHGSSNQSARLAVVCNVNLEELNNDLEEYNLENGDGSWEGTSIKDACRICEGKGKCCAVVLKRS